MDARFALTVLSVLLVSGCTDSSPAVAPLTSDALFAYGVVSGRALTDELVPVANATISLTEAAEQTLTGADGGFIFPAVRVGSYTIAATHELYNETIMTVVVTADEVRTIDLTLVKKPEFRPRNETVLLEGSFDCGAEAPIITGPCWTLVEGVSCGEPINNCVYDPLFKSDYAFRFDVKPRWQTIVAELVWTSGATAMDGMRLYVENANQTKPGAHAPGVAKVHGNAQPLVARIDRGTPGPGHENYEGTSVPAYVPDDGGLQQVRVFPKGQAYSYTSQVCRDGQCFLGLGVGLNVRFTVHLTVFYNEAAPVGFSDVPKS